MGTLVQLFFPLMDVEMTIHSLDDIPNFSSRYTGLIEFDNHLFQVVISTSISGKQSWTKVPITISNISKATQENVAAFHERSLEANYSVLFLDGTYLPLRRGTVSKECIHIALGITPV